MTTLTYEIRIKLLSIKKKGYFGYPYLTDSKIADEDGVRHITWYLEPNTPIHEQIHMAHRIAMKHVGDVYIDEDIVDDVCDEALMVIAKGIE